MKFQVNPLTSNISMEVIRTTSRYNLDIQSGQTEVFWADFVQELTRFDVREAKDGPGFIPAAMKPAGTWVQVETTDGRKHFNDSSNFQSISMLVIDLDAEGSLEGFKKLFDGYEYVVHSTFSFDGSTDSYRAVLPLVEPISSSDWPVIFNKLSCIIQLDEACSNMNRAYLLPSLSKKAKAEGVTPRFHYNRGLPLSKNEIGKLFDRAPKRADKKSLRLFGNGPTLHFSGVPKKYVPIKDDFQDVVYGVDEMYARCADLVEELKATDSRHNFALKVISREIAKFGSAVQVSKVIEFLFHAAANHSSKELGQGNTAKELPEIFVSSYMRCAPEEFKNMLFMVSEDPSKAKLEFMRHVRTTCAKFEKRSHRNVQFSG